MDLVVVIYKLTSYFPPGEKFGLTNQMRRAAVSIPSNIAEGCARNSSKELKQFLYIARGSLAELETQVQIALRLEFIKSVKTEVVYDIEILAKMLNSLINKINT